MNMLRRRRAEPHPSTHDVIFPSTTGGLRDPNNIAKQWRKVRDTFSLPDVSSHSFRKSLATRVGADHLGHRHVSMTQDRYFGRGRQHHEMLDRTLTHVTLQR